MNNALRYYWDACRAADERKKRMAQIPRSISLLQSGRPHDLQLLLIAALLRRDEDEEAPLIIKEEDVERARNYSLVTTVVEDEGAIILSTRLRK